MAGTFQVLDGAAGGTFKTARTLNGSDGEPLIITADARAMTDKICTRPTAVDLDADGHLDLVVGNFTGTFHLFRGGPDGFAPTSTEIKATNDKPLRIDAHSDPYLVDWDGDGDLDLFSGSVSGGVFYAPNVGTVNDARFEPFKPLIKPVKIPGSMKEMYGREMFVEDTRIGTDFLTEPQKSTRVYVADVNGDGALDILVGDTITLYHPADGVSDEQALAAQQAYREKERAHFDAYPDPNDADAMESWNAEWEAFKAERNKTVTEEMTGFVWVYHQKK